MCQHILQLRGKRETLQLILFIKLIISQCCLLLNKPRPGFGIFKKQFNHDVNVDILFICMLMNGGKLFYSSHSTTVLVLWTWHLIRSVMLSLNIDKNVCRVGTLSEWYPVLSCKNCTPISVLKRKRGHFIAIFFMTHLHAYGYYNWLPVHTDLLCSTVTKFQLFRHYYATS